MWFAKSLARAFSVYIFDTAPQLALGKGKRRVSEKPGLLIWDGGGVALVPASTPALGHLHSLRWPLRGSELLSGSVGVVSGSSGLGRFWAAWGNFLGLPKAMDQAKGLGSPGPRPFGKSS